MSQLDWKALQAKVIRALQVTLSTLLVASCGDAIAAEYPISPSSVSPLQQEAIAPTEAPPHQVSHQPSLLSQTLPLTSVTSRNEDASSTLRTEEYEADSNAPTEDPTPPEEQTQSEAQQRLIEVPVGKPRFSFEPVDSSAKERLLDTLVSQNNTDINVENSDGSINSEASDAEGAAQADVEGPTDLDLTVPVRFGASYSTSHAGFDDIVGVGAFIPIEQSAGKDITFFEGNVQLSDGYPNFNLNVGHRSYDIDDEVLHGGYLGVDSRTTDRTTFYQLAAGYEQIRDDWEFRLNGYVPIGGQTSTGATIINDSGLQSSQTFQGNQLVLATSGNRQLLTEQENALGGVDLEVGMQLDEWNSGELRGFLGGYWLSGEDSTLGVKARLLAEFASNFNAGLSVQHDGIFGTSVGFGVNVSLPGTRFHDREEREFQEENEVAIRLRDSVTRRPTVMVDERIDIESIEVDESAPLRNPEEEEDYRFLHVDLARGSGAGDGSFEDPFGAVEDAIALINGDADTFSDGNTIVYVDGEDATASVPSFSIPNRVSVLSRGPEQTIAGMAFSDFPTTATRLPFSSEQNFNIENGAPNANGIAVVLPESGNGVFPIITGGADSDLVALGDNTVLSGFDIRDASGSGVSASGVTNVEVRNNRIENAGSNGISLNNVGGSAILFDNEINNSAQRGISVENTDDSSVEVAIAGFELDNNNVGMAFVANSTAGSTFPNQRIKIGPSSDANTSRGTIRENAEGAALSNSITNSNSDGLTISAIGNAVTSSASQEVSVSDITIDNSGAAGVRLNATSGAHTQEITIENSRIVNNDSDGITVINGQSASAFATAAAQEFVLRNSVVDGNGGDGLDISVAALSAQELVIRNNQITNNAGDGIRSAAQNFSLQEWRTDEANGDAGISENTIANNGAQGISISVADSAAIPIISVADNTLADNGSGPDIEIVSTSIPTEGAAVCLVLDENAAPLGIQLTGPDPLLTGNVASILVQDLASLLADSNITFITDELTGGITVSEAAFANEENRCIP